MENEHTAELIISADGHAKHVVFAEELVAAAPKIDGWKFTALKQPVAIDSANIQMNGHTFNSDNIRFYANTLPELPDEIDIVVVHNDFSDDNKNTITNGTYIFLDNYLGELNFLDTIDNLKVTGPNDDQPELIPIERLKSYLLWRQKEFIEKYDGVRWDTENDNYALFEANMANGNSIFAMIDTDILKWDRKASHPWILTITIRFDGSKTAGMPDLPTSELLNTIEDEITLQLKDADGYLYIGRETAESVREIFFACKDFRRPSKVAAAVACKYARQVKIDHELYRDKYWQSFNRFIAG